jgi:transposase-like protein
MPTTDDEPVEIKVDNVQFSLGDITDYDSYMDLKPPEKEQKTKRMQESSILERSKGKKEYTRHSSEKKSNFFRLIYQKDYKVSQAAKELDVKRRTAYDWYKKDQDEIERDQTDKDVVKQEEKKRVGRPKILGEEHKEFLKKMYGDESRTTVNEAVEGLIAEFSGLKIAKTAVHDFMTNDCALSFKKASFEPEDRNSEKSIAARYDWAVKLMETDIDSQSNCIFIDESAFHINLSRTMAWSVQGTKADCYPTQDKS